MIFVIGGNGFVGSGFVRHLRTQEVPVTVVDRTNYEHLRGAECDVLINANGNSKKNFSKNDPKGDFQASVSSVRDSLVDFKFKKYVFLSSGDVYPNCSKLNFTREDSILNPAEQSPYGFHKYLAELCVQHAAKDWLIFRGNGFVGQGMKKNSVFDVLYGEKLWVHPDSRFQFINTDDSARLVMELLNRGFSNHVFNLTATGTISVHEMMLLAGRSIPYDPTMKPVYCELSTEKASQHLFLPSTFETIQKFFMNNQK